MINIFSSLKRWYLMYTQKEFIPENPNKCLNLQMSETKLRIGKQGKSNLPYARSSWELRFFSWCDKNENVKKWGSEIYSIEYITPDKKKHTYYPDIYFEAVNKDGTLTRVLAEVKPNFQTQAPKPPKIKNKRSIEKYKKAAKDYVVNMAKWKYANMWCNDRGIQFRLITEYELGLKKRKL